jgi:C4-dicarboxylate-specific signal transduction histidine kinase
MLTEAAGGGTKGVSGGSLERLRGIERAEERLWFLALVLFLMLAVSLFLLDASAVTEERAIFRWTGRVAGFLRDYAVSGALMIIAWLVCAYLHEKLMQVRRENRELVRMLDATARTLARRNQQLSTWSQLSHDLITNFNLPRLLDLIARTAAEVTESDCAAVILAENGARHLRLAAIHDRGLQIQLAERVAQEVIAIGHGMRLSPESPPEGFARPDLPWEDLTSLAAEPLVAGEKPVGALLVGRLKPHEGFSDQVLGVLDSFASQASIALEKAHLYAENQRQLGRLGKLLDDLHATQAQLTEAEKAAGLGALAGAVAYVVNNPVAAALARADRLLAGGQRDERTMWEELTAIRGLAARVSETLNGLLALARRPGSGRAGAVDLNQAVHAALNVVRSEYRAAGIEIEESYGSVPAAWGNAAQLQQALLNLFVGILHEVGAGALVAVRTSAPAPGSVQVAIEQHAEDPGHAFYTGFGRSPEEGGGLAAAERLLRGQGGAVVMKEAPDGGRGLCVSLPAAGGRGTEPATAALVEAAAEPAGIAR